MDEKRNIEMTAKRALLAGIVAALLPSLSIADSRNQGYLVDSYGNNISTSSNTGLCWRSSDWTPARSVEPCDPVAAKVAQAPAPRVAAAVAPPASAPAAPARIAPQATTFSADALFAFDKSVLRPEGKATLDDFARQLGNARYDSILVTGHTDRLGSSEYNQKLSERRANAVKDYLVSRDIPADRITAEGRGETQPVTPSGACSGPRSVKVIECLQPDRRVHAGATATADRSASSR